MSSPPPSIRQRGGQNLKKTHATSAQTQDDGLSGLVKRAKRSTGVGSEWDYKVALLVITVLAFVTRFWGIGHPDQVVFDEVHFGKVSVTGRKKTQKSDQFDSSLTRKLVR